MKRHGLLILLSIVGAQMGQQELVSATAQKLHRKSIVVDTHMDTTPKLQRGDWKFIEEHADGHVDLPRLRKGGLDAAFFSIYMSGTVTGPRAVADSLERIATVHRLRTAC